MLLLYLPSSVDWPNVNDVFTLNDSVLVVQIYSCVTVAWDKAKLFADGPRHMSAVNHSDDPVLVSCELK